MAYPSLLSLSFAFLVLLFHGCFGLLQRFPTECNLEKLSALEPTRQVESEGGVTQYWDASNEQFQCAGVAALRYVMKPKALLLPFYSNAPRLHYVLQGTGILETVVPGCPETFQQLESEGDQHQKIHSTREGDVIVVPAGAAQWIYNTGQTDLILFSLVDSANVDNQLDLKVRNFFLAGNPREQSGSRWENWTTTPRWELLSRGRRAGGGTNVFSGLAAETVVESFDINEELARKVQGMDDTRGSMVIVEGGLDVLSPTQEEERRRREEEREREREGRNGLEETLCTLRLVHQLAEATDADKYNPRGGHLTGLNTPNLPVLKYVQLGVDRGVLYKNAMMVPHYNLNCHAIIYGTKGSCWVQVVTENGRKVFDGELREGQILIVPQHFVLVKKAGNDGFDWIAMKTSDNPMINPLAGRLSLIRTMPDSVLMYSYRVSKEEAKELKKRGELTLFSPRKAERSSY